MGRKRVAAGDAPDAGPEPSAARVVPNGKDESPG